MPSPIATTAAALSSSEKIGAARTRVAAQLRAAGLASADLDARLLLCAACGIGHLDLVSEPDRPVGSAADRLRGFAARRAAREPVSRILGTREFWGLSFAISPAVLDPRPDTEGMVGAVLDALGGRQSTPIRVLDLGTGSGAILAALLHELPGAFGIGLDRSPEACRVARANLETLGLSDRAGIVCGCWSAPLAGRFEVIVSNPPYIPSGVIAALEVDVREHDPLVALDGGEDGLDAYRAILPGLVAHLAPGGVAAMECGWDQGEAVVQLCRDAGLRDTSLYADLAGHGRVVLGYHRAGRCSTVRKPLGERNENA